MRISAQNYSPASLAAFWLIVLLFTASCSNSENANANNANQNVNANAKNKISAKDNADELSALIKLPIVPDDKLDERVDWREDTVHQKGKRLTAVLKYNEENTAQIVALAEKHKPAAPVQVGVEEWYPEELTAQTQLSGNESLKGLAFDARDFYNSPYTRGRLIKIAESNFFILELTTY
jgi:hypothetical protein